MGYKHQRHRHMERAKRHEPIPVAPICCVDVISQRRCCCCLVCERPPFVYIPATTFIADHHWVTEKIEILNDVYMSWYRQMLTTALILLFILPPVGLVMLCMLRSVLLRDAVTRLAHACERTNRESVRYHKGLFFTVFRRGRLMIVRITTAPNMPMGQPPLAGHHVYVERHISATDNNPNAALFNHQGSAHNGNMPVVVNVTAQQDQPPPYEAMLTPTTTNDSQQAHAHHAPVHAQAHHAVPTPITYPRQSTEPEPEPDCGYRKLDMTASKV
eukprot:Selendium_serpulae@DN6086_c13_g1_i1.p1